MGIMENRGIDRQMMLDALALVSTHGYGRQVRHNASMSRDEEEIAMRLRKSGVSYELIGLALKLSAETVRTHLRRLGH